MSPSLGLRFPVTAPYCLAGESGNKMDTNSGICMWTECANIWFTCRRVENLLRIPPPPLTVRYTLTTRDPAKSKAEIENYCFDRDINLYIYFIAS